MTDKGGMSLIENTVSSVVITAQAFNPSIFTETWLAENGIIAPQDLTGTKVFSPGVAQFQTPKIQVLVIPPKMQITSQIHESTTLLTTASQIAIKTVRLLPHTPYQGLGLNFDFFVTQPNGQEFNAYNRALLGGNDYKLFQEFSSQDAKFGRYLSKDHGGARLKLDIKPVKAGPDKKDLLKFSFNYDHNVENIDPGKRADALIKFIETYDALREHAETLVNLGITL